MLIKISIPIHNYYRDGVYYQELYFDTDHSPSKNEVLIKLQDLHNEDSKYPLYLGCWEDCINSVNNISEKDWPFIDEYKIHSNSFVNRQDLRKFDGGYLPITIKVIDPHKLTRE